MIFPELIWTPNVKAIAGGLAPRRYFQQITAGPAAQVSVSASFFDTNGFVIDRDFVFVLLECGFRCTPGAAQTANGFRVLISDATGANTLFECGQNVDPAIAAARVVFGQIAFPDGMVLQNGEHIDLTTTFSAGGAANTVIGSIYGLYIPRGNWQV